MSGFLNTTPMYYLYILYSAKSDKYYSGISDSPFIRLEVHNTSERKTFTSKHRPWVMVALFACSEDLGGARKIEYFLKRNKSRSLLEWLLDSRNVPSGELAQLVIPYERDRTCGPALEGSCSRSKRNEIRIAYLRPLACLQAFFLKRTW